MQCRTSGIFRTQPIPIGAKPPAMAKGRHCEKNEMRAKPPPNAGGEKRTAPTGPVQEGHPKRSEGTGSPPTGDGDADAAAHEGGHLSRSNAECARGRREPKSSTSPTVPRLLGVQPRSGEWEGAERLIGLRASRL